MGIGPYGLHGHNVLQHVGLGSTQEGELAPILPHSIEGITVQGVTHKPTLVSPEIAQVFATILVLFIEVLLS